MAEITPIKKEQLRRKRRRRLIWLIVLTLLLIGLLILYLNRDALQNFQVEPLVEQMQSSAASDQFPITLPSSNTYQMLPVSGKLVLLTDTHLYVYNNKGKLLTSLQHGMSRPRCVVNDSRAAVFERGGKQIDLLTLNTLKSSTHATDNPIFDVALSDDAKLCVIENSARFVSELIVYNSKMEEIYRWSSQNLLLGATFNGNNDLAAFSASSSSGQMQSEIFLLNLNKEQAVSAGVFSDNLLLSIDAKKDGHIVAVGDRAAVSLDRQGKQVATYAYPDEGVSYFDNSAEQLLLVLGDFTKYKSNQIVVTNVLLEPVGTFTSASKVLDWTVGDKSAAVLFANQLVQFAEDGKTTLVNTDYGYAEVALLSGRLLLRNAREIQEGLPASS